MSALKYIEQLKQDTRLQYEKIVVNLSMRKLEGKNAALGKHVFLGVGNGSKTNKVHL